VDLYYNPEQMPAAEIKQTFVGREPTLKELSAPVRRQPQGAGVHHVLLIGARGIGEGHNDADAAIRRAGGRSAQ
jgi:hypothetical protein